MKMQNIVICVLLLSIIHTHVSIAQEKTGKTWVQWAKDSTHAYVVDPTSKYLVNPIFNRV
jgi:hypothetical protein